MSGSTERQRTLDIRLSRSRTMQLTTYCREYADGTLEEYKRVGVTTEVRRAGHKLTIIEQHMGQNGWADASRTVVRFLFDGIRRVTDLDTGVSRCYDSQNREVPDPVQHPELYQNGRR